MERAMRRHVDTTSTPLPGWDKQAPERPPSFMMATQFAGVIVVQLGHPPPLARPLSGGQHQYLTALDVPATCFTLPSGSQRTALAGRRLLRQHQRILHGAAMDHPRPCGMLTGSHQEWACALARGLGPACHGAFARRESRLRVADRGRAAMGLAACTKL